MAWHGIDNSLHGGHFLLPIVPVLQSGAMSFTHLTPVASRPPRHQANPLTAAALPRPWPQWLLLPLLVMLVAAPASTKVAGAAWLLVVLAGLWAALRLPVARPLSHPLVQSSRLWLSACLLALVLQAVATLYWADPWGDRHVEIRLLLGAAASYALVRRLYLLPQQKTWLTHALALACCVALGVSYLYSRDTPSNAIPWAAGVSFIVCLLLPRALRSHTTRWQRALWGLGVLAGVAAVLLSQSRGSYGLVLWVIGLVGIIGLQHFLSLVKKNSRSAARTVSKGLLGIAAAGVLLVILLLSFPRIYVEPVARVQDAWSEIKGLNQASQPHEEVLAINTSVGARLHMWRMAVKEVGQAPLLGHGRKARIAWTHQLGETAGSDTIKSLGHLHSDPLTTLFEHGLFGLLSYLSFGAGLAWLALRGKQRDTALRWSLAGVLWMHLSSGLTNMNFGHNYYGVMLALSVALVWILSTDEVNEDPVQESNEADCPTIIA